MQSVTFEGDCLQVIEAANKTSLSENELCTIMHDIYYLLSLAPNQKITFTFRDVDHVAHILAKHACILGDDQIWIEEISL